MPALQLYDTLLRFTLFQGMGHDELEQLVAGTRLDFIKLPRAATLLHEGDPVGRLLLLTNGMLRAVTRSADRGYAVAEQIRPPFTIEPERIFGLHQASARTFEATTDANLIAIDKAEVAALCGRFMAFRLNMANMLATQTQRTADSLWLAGRRPGRPHSQVHCRTMPHGTRAKGNTHNDGTPGLRSERQQAQCVARAERLARSGNDKDNARKDNRRRPGEAYRSAIAQPSVTHWPTATWQNVPSGDAKRPVLHPKNSRTGARNGPNGNAIPPQHP